MRSTESLEEAVSRGVGHDFAVGARLRDRGRGLLRKTTRRSSRCAATLLANASSAVTPRRLVRRSMRLGGHPITRQDRARAKNRGIHGSLMPPLDQLLFLADPSLGQSSRLASAHSNVDGRLHNPIRRARIRAARRANRSKMRRASKGQRQERTWRRAARPAHSRTGSHEP